MRQAPTYKIFALLLLLLGLSACTGGSKQKEIWIYTSSYKEALAMFEPGLKTAFPDVKIQWFQAGSESIASKLLAELQGGGSRADLLITADLFFFNELKKMGALAPIDASLLDKAAPGLIDGDRAYVVNRFSVMALAYNKKAVKAGEEPKSFADLKLPQYKDKLTMPSPIESGTTLTSVMFLRDKLGMDYFKALRANNILSSGGNSTSLSRIQSGERPVGLVLVENVMLAKDRGQDSVEYVIPSEGAIPVPSPIAMLKSSKNPELAQKVLAWFLSPAAQEVQARNWVYPAFPGATMAPGIPAWESLRKLPWSLAQMAKWTEERQTVKSEFQSIVLK